VWTYISQNQPVGDAFQHLLLLEDRDADVATALEPLVW
jgi:hypothetical protein